jgi:PhzF family phenazine biosynthesis protein
MQDIVQVDAFTSEPFKGNPAAVCIMEGPADETWMQKVAMEMNLSETAFVYPLDDGYSLRWFTPGAEVELCGHATLASAHVLFSDNHVPSDSEIRFHTRFSGTLIVKRDGDRLLMDFPVLSVIHADIPAGIEAAVGMKVLEAATAQDGGILLLEVESAEELRQANPDLAFISRLDAWGICITAGASGGYDFVSRCFAPKYKINEDPATGSAQCALVDYWAPRLNKTEFRAFQASQRRGEFYLRKDDDRCLIGGQAVTTMRGKLEV